jgi:predicted permease
MRNLLQDLRYAIRMLAKNPGFTLIAVLTLALGIGANTAIFSVVNTVLLRPLPYPHPEQIVYLQETFGPEGTGSVSAPNYLDWREQSHSFSALAVFETQGANLLGTDQPVHLKTARVSSGFFESLGATPEHGRLFSPDEFKSGSHAVALISDRLWRVQLGSDPGLVGKLLHLSGEDITIVGILPPTVTFPGHTDIWLPHHLDDAFSTNRGSHFLGAIGRLQAGTTLPQARMEMDAITQRLARAYPATNLTRGVLITPLKELFVQSTRPALLVLLGAVAFVLLIACANVANLLLARATSRQREIVVRCALGATRGRLISQLLTESLLLSLVSAALGLAIGQAGLSALLTLVPAGTLPPISEIRLDANVLFFAVGISVLTGVLFGFSPALQATRASLSAALNRGTSRGTPHGGTSRLRSSLVVSEVAVTAILLVGGSLMLRTLWSLLKVDPGFEPSRVLTADLNLPKLTPATVPSEFAHLNEMRQRLRHLPGVDGASFAVFLPLSGNNVNGDVAIEGRPLPQNGQGPIAEMRVIQPDFFRVLQIPLLRGRDFDEHDSAYAEPVAIINDAMARHFWPEENPLGSHIAFQDAKDKWQWLRIVGVVGNVHTFGLTRDYRDEVYLLYHQIPVSQVAFLASVSPLQIVIRSKGDPGALATAVRTEIQGVDHTQPVSNFRTMTQVVKESIGDAPLLALLLSVFGALALLLAAVGIYSVMAYVISLRTQEFGIRIALGATSADVLRLTLLQGMRLAASGLLIGLLAAVAIARIFASQLFGVKPTDPLAFAGAAALLALCAALACYLPARRATRVDPLVALRYE